MMAAQLYLQTPLGPVTKHAETRIHAMKVSNVAVMAVVADASEVEGFSVALYMMLSVYLILFVIVFMFMFLVSLMPWKYIIIELISFYCIEI